MQDNKESESESENYKPKVVVQDNKVLVKDNNS